MHSFRFFVEIDECCLDLSQMMTLLKKTGGHKRHDKILTPVRLLSLFDKRLPLCVREFDTGRMYIVSPAADVLDHHLFRCVYRKSTRCALGPGARDSPGVLYIHLSVFGIGIVSAQRILNEAECLILVDKAVRAAASDGFHEILAFS